jgi:hypothetical protein
MMSSLRVLPPRSTDLIRFDFGSRSESRRGSSERGQAIVATVEPAVRKGLEETGYVAGQNDGRVSVTPPSSVMNSRRFI